MPRSKAVVLAELRKHKEFASVLATVQVDQDGWAASVKYGEEVELLTGKKARV